MKPTPISVIHFTSAIATIGLDAVTNTVNSPELVAAGMVTGAIAIGTGLKGVMDNLKEEN